MLTTKQVTMLVFSARYMYIHNRPNDTTYTARTYPAASSPRWPGMLLANIQLQPLDTTVTSKMNTASRNSSKLANKQRRRVRTLLFMATAVLKCGPVLIRDPKVSNSAEVKYAKSPRRTYREYKIQDQREHQGSADDKRANHVIKVPSAAPNYHGAAGMESEVAPAAREDGNNNIRNPHQLSEEVLTGGRVQADSQAAEQDTNVLPLEKRPLVSQPDLGLDLQWPRVLDPFCWFYHTFRERGFPCTFGLGILGEREAGKDQG
jgi:hypothetical protein